MTDERFRTGFEESDRDIDCLSATNQNLINSRVPALYKNKGSLPPKDMMASKIFHPLLYLIASATKQELTRQLHYLKVENQILRARLPKNIQVRAEERQRLLKVAKGVGKAIRDLTSIVTYRTFLKWMREVSMVPKPAASKRKPGRPKTTDEIRVWS